MSFPVLAFTPNGVMPYTSYDNLLRVTKREYDLNWYVDLEIIDSKGECVVVRWARIVKEPLLARILGRIIDVEIESAEKLVDYDVDAVKSRVAEFLSLYPEMYESAGVYDELINEVQLATMTHEIVYAFVK